MEAHAAGIGREKEDGVGVSRGIEGMFFWLLAFQRTSTGGRGRGGPLLLPKCSRRGSPTGSPAGRARLAVRWLRPTMARLLALPSPSPSHLLHGPFCPLHHLAFLFPIFLSHFPSGTTPSRATPHPARPPAAPPLPPATAGSILLWAPGTPGGRGAWEARLAWHKLLHPSPPQSAVHPHLQEGGVHDQHAVQGIPTGALRGCRRHVPPGRPHVHHRRGPWRPAPAPLLASAPSSFTAAPCSLQPPRSSAALVVPCTPPAILAPLAFSGPTTPCPALLAHQPPTALLHPPIASLLPKVPRILRPFLCTLAPSLPPDITSPTATLF